MSPSPSVMIVGAGPTGLTLATELLAAGVAFRVIDSAATAVHESRALAIQARTLEVLERDGIAARLVSEGDTAPLIELHAGRDVTVPLFDGAEERTRYPFLLFLSQAKTEQLLLDHLQAKGVRVERNTRLVGLTQHADHVVLELAGDSGHEFVTTGYVVGCDGAHSAVRALAGIEFAGSGFPQTFAIADLEVDGLATGRVHSYLTAAGILFFFPLGEPSTWRLLGMLPPGIEGHLDLAVLQRVVEDYVGGERLTLRDPVWVTRFQVQSRRARRFRQGRVLLGGDAAHIHSPAGAQGMNTGIQDAVNLGWKLAQVVQGSARPGLLASYEGERLPVARAVLRMTDRLFRMATTSNPVVRFVRPRLAPRVLGVVTRSRLLRQLGFRMVSQIGITYRNGSLARAARSGRLGRLHAGDRLPAFPVVIDGRPADLRDRLVTPGYLLAVIGAGTAAESIPGPVTVVRADWPPGRPRARVQRWLLVRPDGHIAGIWRDRHHVLAFLGATVRHTPPADEAPSDSG